MIIYLLSKSLRVLTAKLKEIVDLSMEKQKEQLCDECGLRFYAFRGLLLHLNRSVHLILNASQTEIEEIIIEKEGLVINGIVIAVPNIFAAFPLFIHPAFPIICRCIPYFYPLHLTLFAAAFPMIYCVFPNFNPCISR